MDLIITIGLMSITAILLLVSLVRQIRRQRKIDAIYRWYDNRRQPRKED